MSGADAAGLWERYREFRRLEDREQLILAYQHLVAKVSGRTNSGWFNEDDATQSGTIGLCDAIDRYDPAHGVPFEAYATVRIKGEIAENRRGADTVSRRTRSLINKVEQTRDTFAAMHDRAPTAEELEGLLNLGLNAIATAQRLGEISTESLDAYADDLDHIIGSDPGDREDDGWWRAAVRSLPDDEKTVVTLHFLESLTLDDISVVLGCSKTVVHGIKAKALTRLQEAAA